MNAAFALFGAKYFILYLHSERVMAPRMPGHDMLRLEIQAPISPTLTWLNGSAEKEFKNAPLGLLKMWLKEKVNNHPPQLNLRLP